MPVELDPNDLPLAPPPPQLPPAPTLAPRRKPPLQPEEPGEGGAPGLPTGPPPTPGGEPQPGPAPVPQPAPVPAPPAPPTPTPTPTPVPYQAPSDLGPFAGVGFFTDSDPGAAARGGGKVQWIALHAETADPTIAAQLRSLGYRIVVWESAPSQGQAAVDRFGAVGWIGQAEGPGELAAAEALKTGLTVPRALVTNLYMDAWPADWICLPEAYENDNPQATVGAMIAIARARGATVIAPVLGIYESSGRRVTLSSYAAELAAVGASSWSIYLAEGMTEADWAWLQRSPAAPPGVPGPAKPPLQPTTGEEGGAPGLPTGPPPPTEPPPPAEPPGPPELPDDLDQAIADWAAQPFDESELPELELVDPFAERTLAAVDARIQPLKGQAALAALLASCDLYGIDVKAACADGLYEGFHGGIGDGGWAYGPFQDHLTAYAGRPWFGHGQNNPTVQAWAWSANGIAYSIRQMATSTPTARGKHGHAAVYAIVYGYERPGDKPGAYRTRAAEYDHLVRLGPNWTSFVIANLAGTALGTPGPGGEPVAPGSPAPPPAGVLENWRGLVNVFRLGVPRHKDALAKAADSLKAIFP